MKEPKTLAEYAAEASGAQREIAGRPADTCPYCGCAMFANGTRKGVESVFRYVHCRNDACGKRFVSRQPPATIVREIDDQPSSSGPTQLTIHRDSA